MDLFAWAAELPQYGVALVYEEPRGCEPPFTGLRLSAATYQSVRGQPGSPIRVTPITASDRSGAVDLVSPAACGPDLPLDVVVDFPAGRGNVRELLARWSDQVGARVGQIDVVTYVKGDSPMDLPAERTTARARLSDILQDSDLGLACGYTLHWVGDGWFLSVHDLVSAPVVDWYTAPAPRPPEGMEPWWLDTTATDEQLSVLGSLHPPAWVTEVTQPPPAWLTDPVTSPAAQPAPAAPPAPAEPAPVAPAPTPVAPAAPEGDGR